MSTDPIRAELRALLAAGIELAERAHHLAARCAASPDFDVRDRAAYQLSVPTDDDLGGYLRDVHAALARHEGHDPATIDRRYDHTASTPGAHAGPEPDPAELREVIAATARLADRTRTAGLLTPALDLHRAVDRCFQFADDVARLADALIRRQVGRAPDCCDMPWGICPDHGSTLRYGGVLLGCWCTTPGCDRTWTYDRADTACLETATAVITDSHGATRRMCAAHAANALARIPGSTMLAL